MNPSRRKPPGPGLDVLGLGQCSLDQVAVVDGLPAFAGKAQIHAWTERPGGQVATAVLACARLGLRAGLVSSVGDDAAAAPVLAPLRAAGVDVERVRVVPGARTQGAMILVDRKSGERTVLWYRDPALRLPREAVPEPAVARARALLLDAGDPGTAAHAARVARAAGVPVVLDADTPDPGLDTLLAVVDYPVISRDLAERAFGSPRAALEALCERGARLAVVTLGARGAVALGEGGALASPAFQVEVVDTTGAGDVFHAAFAWGLLEGLAPPELLRACNAAAALACTGLGAQGALPTREELRAFLSAPPATRPSAD